MYRTLTFCFSSSERASIRTLAQGKSLGHQGGLVLSLPHPGLPLPNKMNKIIIKKNIKYIILLLQGMLNIMSTFNFIITHRCSL